MMLKRLWRWVIYGDMGHILYASPRHLFVKGNLRLEVFLDYKTFIIYRGKRSIGMDEDELDFINYHTKRTWEG